MDLISKKEVYKKNGIILTEKIFQKDSKEITRVSLSLGKNAVLIIPVDSDNNFYLVQQKRGDSENYIFEFPSGGIEKDESELQAAIRELSEELGLEGDMKYLGKFRPFYSLVDLQVSVFLSSNVKIQPEDEKKKADFYETIKSKKVTEDGLYGLIKEGTMSESYSLSSLSLFTAFTRK